MIRVSTAFKYNLLSATRSFAAMFDDAVIRVYSGSMPASANDAATGTYLAVVTRDGLSPALGHGLHFDISLSGFVVQRMNEIWKLTGQANGVAGWCRLAAVTDPLVFDPQYPRIDFEVNPSDGNGFALSNTGMSVGLTRTVPFFNYYIPG